MTTAPVPQPAPDMKLDRVLEAAVVSSWKDLGQTLAADAIIQIEYHLCAASTVDSLKMWSATARGYWSLMCDYSINPGWSNGPRFNNGFHSRDLGRLLESIMINQHLFQHASAARSNVVIQITAPSEEHIASAKLLLRETFPEPVPTLRKSAPRLRVEPNAAVVL